MLSSDVRVSGECTGANTGIMNYNQIIPDCLSPGLVRFHSHLKDSLPSISRLIRRHIAVHCYRFIIFATTSSEY